MIEGREIHADLGAVVLVAAEDEPWAETGSPGLERKIFERLTGPGLARETGMFRFAAGATMALGAADERVELMVIDGLIEDGAGRLGPGVYLRLPPGEPVTLRSTEGAVVFLRRRAGVGMGGQKTVIDSNDRSLWQAWGGRGNQRILLTDPAEPAIGAWLGYMFPAHQAPEHDHAGGEEVFMLYGELEDHLATCRAGTWARYPVGFRHAPVARDDGALMLVREGDVTR